MLTPRAKPAVSVDRDQKSIVTLEEEKGRGLLVDPFDRGRCCTQNDNSPGHTGSGGREPGPRLVTGTLGFSPSFGLRSCPSHPTSPPPPLQMCEITLCSTAW